MLKNERLESKAVKSDPDGFREIRCEACANIHRHAYQGQRDGRIDLELESDDTRMQVRIRDYGIRFDPSAYAPPDLGVASEGGYGLFLMKALTDRLKFLAQTAGTEVVLEKYLPGRTPWKAR